MKIFFLNIVLYVKSDANWLIIIGHLLLLPPPSLSSFSFFSLLSFIFVRINYMFLFKCIIYAIADQIEAIATEIVYIYLWNSFRMVVDGVGQLAVVVEDEPTTLPSFRRATDLIWKRLKK